MEQIERIQAMEEKLNAARSAIEAMEAALKEYAAARADILDLDNYLKSEAWRQDFAADEAGLLPAGLRRGVLSEDGIFNVLEADAALRPALRQALQSYPGGSRKRKGAEP